MSKKHFEALADALFLSKPATRGKHPDRFDVADRQWIQTLNAITRVCIESNPNFSVSRFEHRACYGHNLTSKCQATSGHSAFGNETGCTREGK